MTLLICLFMATHIMYDKIAPEDPIKDPTMVNKEFYNKKPSAQRAHPNLMKKFKLIFFIIYK